MFKKEDLQKFTLFDPKKDSDSKITQSPGVYVVLLRSGSSMPETEIDYTPSMVTYDGDNYEAIYVGISKDSLYKRDYQTHFNGNNAGKSTLRKSLGSLMGMKKTHRSEREKMKSNPKTKFIDADEEKLSEWMRSNLLLLFKASPDCYRIETEMIKVLNPPLNLSKNKNEENKDFRTNLTKLRADRSDLI